MTCHRVSAGWRLRPAPTPGAPWPALAWRFSPLRIITSPRATQKIMPAQQDAPIRDVKRLSDIQLPPPRLCCGSGHTLPLASRPARQRTPSGPGCSAPARNEICGQARPCSGARNDRIIWQRLYRAVLQPITAEAVQSSLHRWPLLLQAMTLLLQSHNYARLNALKCRVNRT